MTGEERSVSLIVFWWQVISLQTSRDDASEEMQALLTFCLAHCPRDQVSHCSFCSGSSFTALRTQYRSAKTMHYYTIYASGCTGCMQVQEHLDRWKRLRHTSRSLKSQNDVKSLLLKTIRNARSQDSAILPGGAR